MIKNSLVTSAKESSAKHGLGACLQVGRRDSKRWETAVSSFLQIIWQWRKENHKEGTGFRENWLCSEQWRQEQYGRQMKDRNRQTKHLKINTEGTEETGSQSTLTLSKALCSSICLVACHLISDPPQSYKNSNFSCFTGGRKLRKSSGSVDKE